MTCKEDSLSDRGIMVKAPKCGRPGLKSRQSHIRDLDHGLLLLLLLRSRPC